MTADDEMPERIGPYRLLERIGEGGMGVVFMARDAAGKTVALKVLRSVVAEEPMARRRLAREVETMRRVRSPYVAEVIDADLAGDMPYIVTRYVPGRTLEQVVTESGPLPPSALGRLACGLADALAAVHAAGVVHRDLKPSNVMLLDEVPVVIDFGIAQGPDATRLTMTGMFMGTPGYLAPEVIEGQPSSEASDVHAWAATVAFAATGHPPFGSGGYEAIFYRIVNGQPDLTGAPASLLPLLAAALTRDPGLRPPAAQLSAQAAVLAPAALAPGTVLAGDGPVSPSTVVPVTSADRAPGGPLAAGGRPASPNGGGPAPVRADTQPLQAIRPARADFADVLPPVQYVRGPVPPSRPVAPPPGYGQKPAPAPRPRRAPAKPPPANPFAPPTPASKTAKRRWPSAMVAAALLVAVGISVVLPVVGALSALVLIILLRAGELTHERRSVRGARPRDRVLLVALSPWYLVRSVLGCLLIAPFALVAALLAAGVTVAISPGHHLPRAVAAAAGTLVAFYGFGPGSARPRRQLNRLFAAVPTGRAVQVVALAGMTALALATLAAAASWPSLYWPAGAPGGVWHFGLAHAGPIRHLGLVGRSLLARLHGG
jgi:tRNA A-37 threonylcarbamoyl transferase component Bud32